MKHKLFLMLSLLLVSVGIGLVFDNTTGHVDTAMAKTKTLKAFPKAYRHTWYRYSNSDYDKLVVKSQSLEFIYPSQYFHSPIEQKVMSRKTHGHTWIIAQDKTNTAGTKFFFRTTTKKWGGKKHKALIEVRGSAFSMPVTYYSTKTTHK